MEKIPIDREAAAGTPYEQLYQTPEYWPRHIHRVPIGLFDYFGRDARTNQLYWDGQALVTEKRFSTQERVIAWIGVALAAIGVAATVVQAWFATFPHPPTP